MSTTVLPGESPSATPSVAEQHLLDVRRIGHHRDDDVGALGDLAPERARDPARLDQLRWRSAAAVQEQLVSAFEEVPRHGARP